MTAAHELRQHALEQTIRYYAAAATTPLNDKATWRANCERAALSSAMAYLLDALIRHTSEEIKGVPIADVIAMELDELLSDGEPMSAWVTEQLGAARTEQLLSEGGAR